MIENLKIRFVRKPQDLEEVLASIHGEWANRIEIQARKALTEVEYDEFAHAPLADREWLAGLGGYLEGSGRRVVEVTAPNRRGQRAGEFRDRRLNELELARRFSGRTLGFEIEQRVHGRVATHPLPRSPP